MKKSHSRLLKGLAALLFTSVVHSASGCVADFGGGAGRRSAELADLEKLWSTIRTHPEFSQVDQGSLQNNRVAMLIRNYKSGAGYDQVKGFYEHELVGQGWRLVEEKRLSDWGRDKGGRSLTFSKGEYRLTMEYAGDNSGGQWDYSISLSKEFGSSP